MEQKAVERIRNYGIDMLRLTSMFLVVTLHVLEHGGVMRTATGYRYDVSSLLQAIALCAVDCYAIISGFVGYREENENVYHYGKYLKFWVPVFIYNLGITICFYVLAPEFVNFRDIIKAAMPVTTYGYWYVNAYTALFFLIPWINRFVYKITKKELNQLIFILFMIFCVYSTFSNMIRDTFKMGGGYDFVWLVFLYITGAWIKKNKINEKRNTLFWLFLILCCLAITWIWKNFSQFLNNIFLSYMSVTIVLISVSLVMIFSRLKLNPYIIVAIRVFSPAAFGIYLIHDHHLVRDFLMLDTFAWIGNCKFYIIPILVLGCGVGIFITCLLIEKLRLFLFEILKINQLMKKIEKWIDSILNRCLDKISG